MKKSWPKITYCIITYNEERNIEECLKSIFNQDYPKNKLEVILIDDNSTDKTVEIAKKFPVKIYYNGKKNADLSMTIGLQKATGEFYNGIGADSRLRGRDWFKKMIKPLIENPDMALAITKYYPHPKDSLINKYLNLDPFQRDLVYQFFSADIEDVIKEKREDYFICEYSEKNIPLQVHGLYRVSVMKKILSEQKIWYDMGNLVLLVKKGFRKIGYVPEAGLYHLHAESLSHLLHKRKRNIERSYLRYIDIKSTKKSHFKYFDLKNPKDILKIGIFIIFANVLFPIFVYSVYRAIKNKNWIYLIEAPLTLLLVDTILLTFLTNKRGISLIEDNAKRILRFT